MKKIYQLAATGSYACFKGKTTIVSKHCYASRELAEGQKEDFLEKCKVPTGSLYDLDPEQEIVIRVNEYDLIEEGDKP